MRSGFSFKTSSFVGHEYCTGASYSSIKLLVQHTYIGFLVLLNNRMGKQHNCYNRSEGSKACSARTARTAATPSMAPLRIDEEDKIDYRSEGQDNTADKSLVHVNRCMLQVSTVINTRYTFNIPTSYQ